MENNATQKNQATNALSLDDLNVAGVDVYALAQEETMGVPELGASYGQYGSSTHCSVATL